MVIEVSVFLGPLQGLLNWIQKNKEIDNKAFVELLDSINHALAESRKYSEALSSGKPVNRDREIELAKLWSNAATRAKATSGELAMKLQDKSIYWSGEIKWSRDEVLAKQIDFDAIQNEVKKLLEK